MSFEQYKFSLLYVGRWMGLLFALLYFFLNLKHFFFMLGGVFLGKVPISILMFFLFFSFLYVLTWLNPSIFLHGFGMRSHFSVVLIVFLMTSLLSNGLVAFMWGIGYVKRNG
ncbi:hypothetical protein [Chromobacterium haemolyticum]|uniref:hypothetical protein n=1 Tax=Chromobacterium haemolyticum TaxID=394935 RepID=UPI0011B25E1A|nr:hypothetical protein [Chromobacterium haemolyticum]